MPEAEIHDRALCESADIGPETRIAPFARICAGASVGSGCEIAEGALVAGGVVIGDRVKIGSGVRIQAGVDIEPDVTIGPNAAFTNDTSLAYGAQNDVAARDRDDGHRVGAAKPRTVVRAGVEVGANATIHGGLELGRGALIGAGAVVTRSVPPYAIVSGNPARITGYNQTRPVPPPQAKVSHEPGSTQVPVRGVHVHRFAEFTDLRGSLTAGDIPSAYVPFEPRRWFVVYDVPGGDLRGEHAHRICQQFLVCVAGRLSVALDDGLRRAEVELDGPTIGLYVPPMVWASQFGHQQNTVLVVLASHAYDPDDYIREYEAFRAAVGTLKS
jgi:acetyltransferase-like isoleucine patch superfamily enzyme